LLSRFVRDTHVARRIIRTGCYRVTVSGGGPIVVGCCAGRVGPSGPI